MSGVGACVGAFMQMPILLLQRCAKKAVLVWCYH